MRHINEEFICQNCGHHNPPATKTCRNHCQKCLYSLHVDDKTPGDRASKCHALMKPVAVDKTSKKGYMIIHECTKCHKRIPNKVLPDDDFDQVIKHSVNND